MKNGQWCKVAVVTGAAGGIGREFCRQLAAEGAVVVMVDRAPMDDVVAGIDAPEELLRPLQLDLTAPDAPRRIEEFLAEQGLQADLLVNNAGIFDFKAVTDLSPGRIDLYIDLHMRAVTHLSASMARLMARQGGGRILNMSSMSCWMPMPGIAMYSATKAYLRVFSRALNLEMRPHGVSVTVACPGGIATDLFGLPRKLQRLGVRLGALQTPHRLVSGALKAARRRRCQYINGMLNRVAIVAVGLLPEWVRAKVKPLLLDRLSK